MISWKKLVARIPAQIQVAPKTFFKILWVKALESENVGEMFIDDQQIHINLHQTDKEKVLTYIHEVIHAMSDYHEIGLTERQVTLLEEKCVYYVLKTGNLFI